MGYPMMRLLVLGWLAVLVAGCEDPLEPERAAVALESQGPRTSGDPQSIPISASRIDVSWADNSPNETGWEVHRSLQRNGTYALLVQTGPNITSHSDEGLKPNTEYCYRIRSFKTSGRKTTFAAFTIPTCATTFNPPGAATDVSATPAAFGEVDVSWISKSLNAEGFRLERAAKGEGPWVNVIVLGPAIRSYQDGGQPAEQQVCYRIIVFNTFGDAPPSNVDCTTPPAPPSNLLAKSSDEKSIILSWEDHSSVEDGYELQRSADGVAWSTVASLPANAVAYTDLGLPVNTEFSYRLRAMKDGGFSAFSPTAYATIVTTVPAAPIALQLSPYSSSAVIMWWSIESRLADGYRVERSTNNGGSWVTTQTTPFDVLSIYEEGLPSEQQVCYRVFGFNRVGESPASSMACTIPPAAPSDLVTISIDEQTVEHQWTDNSRVEDGYELWLFYFDGWDYYYYPVYLGPDVTSYRGVTGESIYALAAVKDGGYSDWVYPWAGATAAARQNPVASTRKPPASAQRTPPNLLTRKGAAR